MIQRIQTLFLIAAAVLENGAGTVFTVDFKGLGVSGGELVQRLWPLTIIIGLVPLLALVAIFLFRRRSFQMRVTMLVLLLSLGTLILGAFYIIMFDRKMDITLIWKVKAVFPLISAILAWLAYLSILKDELLVKSYDRLR